MQTDVDQSRLGNASGLLNAAGVREACNCASPTAGTAGASNLAGTKLGKCGQEPSRARAAASSPPATAAGWRRQLCISSIAAADEPPPVVSLCTRAPASDDDGGERVVSIDVAEILGLTDDLEAAGDFV